MASRLKLLCLSVFALATLTGLAQPAAPPPANISPADAKTYFKVLQAVNSKYQGRNLFSELRTAFGTPKFYSAEQILYTLDTNTFNGKGYYSPTKAVGRTLPVPPSALSAADVTKHFDVLAKEDAAQKAAAQKTPSQNDAPPKPPFDRQRALQLMYGAQPWYTADEVRQVENSQNAPNDTNGVPMVGTPSESRQTYDLENQVSQVQQERAKSWQNPFLLGLGGFKIRQSWSDILPGEDISQPASAPSTTANLQGALFSYAHDAAANPYQGSTVANTWSAVGALIYPIALPTGEAHFGSLAPESFTLVPSVSINEVNTENPSNNVDHIQYRLGAAGSWLVQRSWLNEVQVRGSFVYDTDLDHNAYLPAGELDIEPRFIWFTDPDPNANWKQNWYGIGYRNILVSKVPTKEDFSDNSLMDFQVRSWLHMEAGDLQLDGAKWESINGSFFRMGPAVALSLNFPTLFKGFSVNGEYDYLPALSGPTGKDFYVTLGGALTLYQNAAAHQKISLVASYKDGGLTLSKQPVNIFTVGMGVIF